MATVPSIPDQSRGAHAYHVHTRAYILSYLISVRFFLFVDCRVRVRVSSRARDCVSFIFFIAFLSVRCMLKDRKIDCH